MRQDYRSIREVSGGLVVVDGVSGVTFQELAEVVLADGEVRTGQVLEVDGPRALVQVFEGTTGIDRAGSTVRFRGQGMRLAVSPDILGRVFSGLGRVLDGAPAIVPARIEDINGSPLNPFARDYPNEFIQTGISAIDGLNTLVRGQKLPIFSAAGLPHNRLAVQVARQAKVLGAEQGGFAVVFAAMGITFEEADYFLSSFRETGAIERSVLFLNLAGDPVLERVATPRMALTAAEYLAFDLGMHVLTIMTDMTNYCEALREISAARKEVPGRRGYPGYLYTDLSNLYERAGRVKGKPGSITLLPILTMPEDDKTHPIPDLTGYITEGQVILSRPLHQKQIGPPIDVLPSLSRLKDKGIGTGKTRQDHADLFNQLFAAYARGKEAQELAVVLGEAALTPMDRVYLQFADRFEREYVSQAADEDRTIIETLDLGWRLLAPFPPGELKRVRPEFLARYHRAGTAASAAEG